MQIEDITGQHLAILRMIYGYNTQEELAKVGGISATTIHRYETEVVTPKVRQFYEKVLNFDLSNGILFIKRLQLKRQKNIRMLASG